MHRPIIISGTARAGTTFAQELLCRHERIAIAGQTPNTDWSMLWGWLEHLVAQGRWAEQANAKVRRWAEDRGSPCAAPHYAGADEATTREAFARLLRDYFRGGSELPRWGLKLPHAAGCAEHVRQIEQLWPELQWVFCLRDPFVSFASIKNTFGRNNDQATLNRFLQKWIHAASLARERDAPVLQVDRLTEPEDRQAWSERLLNYLREPRCPALETFVDRWPIVHEVVPHNVRKWSAASIDQEKYLALHPKLGPLLAHFGYR